MTKICSNVYKDQQTVEGNVMTAAVYDAPYIFFINKSFVFTNILLRMTAALLTLQLFVDKNSNRGNFSLAQTSLSYMHINEPEQILRTPSFSLRDSLT